MTWPAPSTPTLPPPIETPVTAPSSSSTSTAASPAASPVDPRESPAERRRRSAVPAAAWVALLGGALVLLASAIVVVANWGAIGRGFRVAGLALVTAALIGASERLRGVVPTTAGIVAHVGTFLVAPAGVAVMSLFGVTWPGCLLVGGVLAASATEWQAHRWRSEVLRTAQVGAISLAATGLAALTGTTAGLVAAIAASALLLVGAHRRAAGLAILAVLSPALTALADAGIGAGTFERAGLVGDTLGWSGPIVGLLAGTVLGAVARRRRDNALMLAAWTAPVIGVVTGLASVDGSATAWLCVPALAVVATELCWRMLPGDRLGAPIRTAVDVVAGTLAAVAVGAPFFARELGLGTTTLDHPWAIPTTVTVLALALATARWRALDRSLTDLGIAAALAAALGTLWALDAPGVLIALAGLGAVAIGAYLSRRLHPAAIYVPAVWAGVAIIDVHPSLGQGRAALAALLLAALVGLVAATRARLATGWIGWVEMGAVIGVTAVVSTELVTSHAPTAAVVGGALAAMTIAIVDRRLLPLALAADGVVAVIALDAASRTGTLDPTYWVGWAAIGASVGVLWIATRARPASYGAAAAAVVALGCSMAAFTISAEEFVGLAMAAATALTGVAVTLQRRTPLDGAAVAAGVLVLAATAFDVHPSYVSAGWLLIGTQTFAFGCMARNAAVRALGATTATVAAASWWFTSGLHDRVLAALEPAGITAGDLWMSVATGAAFVAGAAGRRTLGASSWIAYVPGVTIATIWLTAVQLERDTVWAIPVALTIAIAAAAIGAWRRLGALLVGGTAMTAATVFVASGSDLRAIPTWSWLAAGGLALLGVAVLIERAGKHGAAGLRELVERWE